MPKRLSLKDKILSLDGKAVAVGFVSTNAKLGSLQVWGVLRVKSKRPVIATLKSFKTGTLFIIEPYDLEYIGELICTPGEIAYT